MSDCLRCGHPVPPVAGMPCDRHASIDTCWMLMRQQVRALEMQLMAVDRYTTVLESRILALEAQREPAYMPVKVIR